MATFEAQVEALTGISILSSGSNPTQAELTQFLNDGIVDATEKWLIGHPEDREQFIRISGEVTSNGSEKVDRANIISVVRESGTNNDWRPCRKIPLSMQAQVVDTESLSFASKYHPVYMVAEDGAISVFPTPGATTDAFKVYYVNNNPRGDDDNSVTYASSGLAFFPKDKVYLVPLYAAIKSINNNMAGIIADLGTFSVSTVIADTLSAPSFAAPDISGIFSPASSPPAYSEPTVQGGSNELTDVTKLDAENTIDDYDGNSIDFDQWFATAAHYIEGLQDAELAGVQLNKVSTYLNAYGQAMQNELNKFNELNVAYQAQLQQAITEAGLTLQEENQEYAAKLQKYQAEVQAYASEVNTEVQEQATKVQTETAKYQWLQDRAAALQAEYMAAFATPQPAGAAR